MGSFADAGTADCNALPPENCRFQDKIVKLQKGIRSRLLPQQALSLQPFLCWPPRAENVCSPKYPLRCPLIMLSPSFGRSPSASDTSSARTKASCAWNSLSEGEKRSDSLWAIPSQRDRALVLQHRPMNDAVRDAPLRASSKVLRSNVFCPRRAVP